MNPVAARLAELASRFAARAGDERALLAEARQAGDRQALRNQAHKLAGIAAMFGFPAIGEAALALELAAENGADVQAPAAALDALLGEISPTD